MSDQATRPARRGGYSRTAGGMIGALVACFALILVVWLLSRFQHGADVNPAPTVHYRAALAQARSEAPFSVVAPEPEPADMRATSVSWQPLGSDKLWHLGFLTTSSQYVGLYEGTGPQRRFLSAYTPATKPGPPVRIDGTLWLTLTDPSRGETALVDSYGKVTTVVTGTAPRSQLIAFAARLK